MKLDQEIQIVRRCKSGDAAAFRRLYDVLAPDLFTICRRYIRDRQTADDIFQDGFAKIVNGIGGFHIRGQGSLGAWARKVMLNEVLMYLRRRRKDQMVEMDMALMENEPEIEPEQADIRAVPQDVLLQMIEEMPEGYRTVIKLFAFERMPHEEIAEKLGISKKTTSSQLVRARKFLMKKVKQYCQDEDNQQ